MRMSTEPRSAGDAAARPFAATTPSAMRETNRAALLDIMWRGRGVFTASDLIAASGLTRATVLDVCRDLQRRGWIVDAPSTGPVAPGRQALRFAFNRTKTYLLGADIGRRSLSVAVADASGSIVGRATRRFDDDSTRSRSAYFDEVVAEAVDAAGLHEDRISVACIGIAAPVTVTGAPPVRSWFWDSVAVDAAGVQRLHRGWRVRVDNDANLAALAQLGSAELAGEDTYVTLLSGERLGAGIVLGGRLYRGAHGTAGEMDFLERVMGVEGVHGISLLARMLARESLATARGSALARLADAGDLHAVDVLRAAEDGDAVAQDVVERIADRVAAVIATIGSFLDPAAVVIAGGIASSSGPVLRAVQRRLPDMITDQPRVVASTLGRDVVLEGALRLAADDVRAAAFDDQL